MSNQSTVPESEKSGAEERTEERTEEAYQSGHGLAVPAMKPREIIVPDVERAVEAVKAFEELKSKLLVDGKDKVQIGGRLAITRSGFSKIALAFSLSTEITKISRVKTGEYYCAHVIVRAYAPNGRFAEGSASCDSTEFGRQIAGTTHNIESKAATRATNRAIANLVGGGILSKDELDATQDAEQQDGPIAAAVTTVKRVVPSNNGNSRSSMKITAKQISYIKSLAGQPGKRPLAKTLSESFNNKTLESLNADEASRLIDELKAS